MVFYFKIIVILSGSYYNPFWRMMKFIADHMLGRLVTWMRMIGCDVAYNPRLNDDELINLARQEGRLILTRDTHLIQRKGVKGNVLFIHADRYRDQLVQVVRHFSIDPQREFLTRCLRCNHPLSPIEKKDVEGRVPSYVFHTQNLFYTCSLCQRIYWGATHKEAMIKQLQEILSGNKI